MPCVYSPLRYPGGKTKLYSTVLPIIKANVTTEDRIYIEPFAGGAGLALKLLFSGDVTKVVLNDIDDSIFNFWSMCISNAEELCDRIYNYKITIENWKMQRDIYNNHSIYTNTDWALATLVLNRCNISGVIRGGPIGGIDQTGNYTIDARFNKDALIKKIEHIYEYRDNIEVYNQDATFFLIQNLRQYAINKSFVNIDPPYVKKGYMLYENSFVETDHLSLAQVIKQLEHKWIVTYDECELIRSAYEGYDIQDIVLQYSAGQTKAGNELLIYGNCLRPKRETNT